MAIRDESRIIVRSDGAAELELDRVKDGPDGRRLKLARKTLDASVLLPPSTRSAMFPEGCVYHESGVGEDIYVVEFPAQLRTVTWKFVSWADIANTGAIRRFGLVPADRTRTRFRLAFPYTVFVVFLGDGGLRDSHLFFRPEPIHDLREPLFWPCTTNINADNAKICFSDIPAVRRSDGPRGVDRVIEEFWATAFNDHWASWWNHYRGRVPQLNSVWEWEYWSRRTPSWTLGAPWSPYPRSLRELIDAWRARCGGNGRQFDYRAMLDAAQRAPAWRPDAERAGTLLKSDSVAVIHGGEVVEVGAKVTCPAERVPEGLEAGKEYAIAFFYEVSGGVRHAALEGVERAIPLPELLGAGVPVPVVATQAAANPIERLGLSVGLMFRITSREDTANLSTGRAYEIRDMRVDGDGDVEVFVDGTWAYLTFGGGTLLPSVRLVRPQLEDGTFTFDDFRMSVGEMGMIGGSLTRVEEIRAVPGPRVTYECTFVGIGTRPLFADGKVRIAWKTCPWELRDRAVSFGENGLNLDAHSHLLLPSGAVIEPKRLRAAPTDAHPFDVVLEAEPLNEPVPVIRDSKWLGVAGTPCALSHALPGFTIERGTRFRFQREVVGFHPTTTYEVYCVCVGNGGVPEIVFSDGSFVVFDAAAAKVLLAAPAGSDAFCPLPDETIAAAPGGPSANRPYADGEQVLYLGGSASVPKALAGKIASVTYSDTVNKVLDLSIDGETYENVYRKYVERTFVTSGTRFQLDGALYKTADGRMVAVPPDLVAEQRNVQNRGHAGYGMDGAALVIGDFVLVASPTSWNGGESVRAASVALIVSLSTGWDTYVFLYGIPSGVIRPAHQLLTDPRKYVGSRYHEPARRDRVGINHTEGIRKLTLVHDWTVVSDLGALVSVKPGITPAYGWGSVRPDERGAVKQIIGDEALVAFPSEPEWTGRLDELVAAIPRPGDTVRLRAEHSPLYLPGNARSGEEGVVAAAVRGDHLLVDFPSHPGFHAHPRDLEVIQTPPSA